jgi:hypothetical protein
MSGEPRTIGPINIFKGTGGLRHRGRRDLSANGLPCISMGDRQGLKHFGFTRDNAPAGADYVVKESFAAVQAYVSLREELAAAID